MALSLDAQCLTVESSMRISPGSLRSNPAGISETEITARWARRIMLLELRLLLAARRLHPPQSLKVGEIDDKAVKATLEQLVGYPA